MTPSTVILIVVAVVVFDVILVWALVSYGWGGIASGRPAVPPAPDAVSRTFQSFKVDLFNFGFCVHVAVDEVYLHLTPARVLRWLGARPTSIPWDQMTVVKRHFRGRYVTVKIGTHSVLGPAWCLDQLAPEAESQNE